MPLYFFHLASPGHYSTDEVGCEFADAEAAYLEAHQATLEIAFDLLRTRVDPSHHRLDICDAAGTVVFQLPFAEALRPSEKTKPLTGVHASIQRHQQRTLQIASELRASCDRARSLIEGTRELLSKT